MLAAERIKESLKDKPRGARGPHREKPLVAVVVEDLTEVCAAVLKKGENVLASHFLSAVARCGANEEVGLQADDVYDLLEFLG